MSDLKSIERCAGSYPILYAFGYSHEVPVRIQDGLDSEFSHMETVHGTFHVVATSPALAAAAFMTEKPAHVYKQVGEPVALIVLDACVGIARMYGGHFSSIVFALGLVLLGLVQPAKAYTPTQCAMGRYVTVCAPMTANPSARIIQVQPADEEADGPNETRAAWRERCQPGISDPDPVTGMRHHTWAAEGCLYGPR